MRTRYGGGLTDLWNMVQWISCPRREVPCLVGPIKSQSWSMGSGATAAPGVTTHLRSGYGRHGRWRVSPSPQVGTPRCFSPFCTLASDEEWHPSGIPDNVPVSIARLVVMASVCGFGAVLGEEDGKDIRAVGKEGKEIPDIRIHCCQRTGGLARNSHPGSSKRRR